MNVNGEENPYCYFHPKEVVVGICALCLKERLLVLASKQGHHPVPIEASHRLHKALHRKPSIPLPKVFALGSFLHRLEFRHQRSDDSDQDTVTGHEDSFISIKFENNGLASWDHGTSSKNPVDVFDLSCNHKLEEEIKGAKSVVEHTKPRPSLRWRKRIGHLFQLMRWKRSNKANACHVASKVEGVKGKKGWIRALTKRTVQ
ncbi:hypothetical protein CKAN_02665500 [Cinnamomum micranthum f. kanehirae]|uniref:Uncharacterized protein n=1 Tax=Cinnamomum micranthum f. kanehirae TaxID=337451 RepID=A0A3S4Q0P8_9MAGN|nr:hypothetical protein CKAN_02665500 [Cinnamomum micranthum f. kanehirae]